MAEVEVKDGTLVVTMQGWRKLWALKSELAVPLENVQSVEIDPETSRKPSGIRAPGAYFPGLIASGSYRGKKGWDFWDVRRPEKAIVIHLEDERYERLIVEVDDPEGTVKRIQEALPASPPSPPAGN